jgi:hypothetical protein
MMRLPSEECLPVASCPPRTSIVLAVAVSLVVLAGCDQPRRSFKLPDGCVQVRYEAATQYSTCLVASVAMAANYLAESRKFSETRIQKDLKRLGYDETRVGDMKAYLAQAPEKLDLISLSGQLDAEPPTGLQYWLEQRGYPVICVINRHPQADPGFNHAVVVIGICTNPNSGSADIIHYLDPSSADQLHTATADEFEVFWAAGQHVMMVVCRLPP